MNEIEKKTVIESLASGKTQAEVADIVGVDPSSISRFAKKNQELIEKESERFIQALPSIVDQTIRDIITADRVSKVLAGEEKMTSLPVCLRDADTMFKIAGLAYKKQSDVLRALGVFPANSQSIFIQNLIQKNTTNVFSPVVMSVIGKYLAEQIGDEVVDVEVVAKE